MRHIYSLTLYHRSAISYILIIVVVEAIFVFTDRKDVYFVQILQNQDKNGDSLHLIHVSYSCLGGSNFGKISLDDVIEIW